MKMLCNPSPLLASFNAGSRFSIAALLLLITFVLPLRLAAQGTDYIWQPSNEGLFGATAKTFGFARNGNVVVGTQGGIFMLRSGENLWRKTTVQSDITNIVTTRSGTLVAGSAEGSFRSTDNGETWKLCFNLSQQTNFFAAADTLLLATQGGPIYGPPSYYFKSTDDGISWSTHWVNDARGGENWIITNAKRERLLTSDSGILISKDYGKSWKHTGFTPFIYRLLSASPTLLAATTAKGVWQSADNGTSWQQIDTFPFNDLQVAPNGNYFYRFSGGEAPWQVYSTRGIYRSTDNGASRSRVLASLNPTGLGIAPDGTIWVGANSSILRSTDNGTTWQRYDRGISNVRVVDIEYSSAGDLFALAASGRLPSQQDFFALYRSSDDGGNWELLRDSLDNAILTTHPNGTIFATRQIVGWKPDDSLEFADSAVTLLLRSSDRGESWMEIRGEGSVTSVAFNAAGTMAAGFAHRNVAGKNAAGDLAFSTDGGTTWRRLTESGGPWASPAESKPVNNVAVLSDNTILFSGISTDSAGLFAGSGFYRLPPQGTVETLSTERAVEGITVAPDGAILATMATTYRPTPDEPFQFKDGGIYRSTDNGSSWSLTFPLQALGATKFWFDGKGGAFALVEGWEGLRSTDNGLTWTAMRNGSSLLLVTDYQFHSSGSIFALLYNLPQYTIDKGRTWHQFSNGLFWPGATSLAISGEDEILGGTEFHGIYKVERTNGVEDAAESDRKESKGKMALAEMGEGSQSLRFSLGSSGQASLALYNLLGKRMTTFFDRSLEAGEHRVALDLSGFPAGTYLLLLNGPDGLASEKLRIR